MHLKKAFDDADTDRGGTLDEAEFVRAFSGVIGDENTGPKELQRMFMKIDANASGDVDW
jgi:Ca2+-binding EF-hand superfamily protein